MNIFVSGGCKNGKSYHAQRLAQDMAKLSGVPLYYLATMEPHDEEDRARIERHLLDRDGWGFETIEQPLNILSSLEGQADPKGVFLLDSVTALLSNEMFRTDGTVDLGAPQRVAADLAAFARRTGRTVFVSDYIYSDAHRYDALTEGYRSGLALCDRTLAEICEQVIEVAYTSVITHKG